MPQCLLLGRDHDDYTTVTTVAVGERSAASISVGADRGSPSLAYKGHGDVPNEDALFVIDDGDRAVFAVADAHFGHEASHVLIEYLYALAGASIPATASELVDLMAGLGEAPGPTTASESSLVVAQFDRSQGRGSVAGFGDSTLALVTEAGEYHIVNERNHHYVTAGHGWPVEAVPVVEFEASAGDTVMLFTDGLDECHYRSPQTSVRPEHIVAAVQEAPGRPKRVSEVLAHLALAGVNGNPGGQDNLALIVVSV